jgi:hypothetical protein
MKWPNVNTEQHKFGGNKFCLDKRKMDNPG